MKIMVEHLRPCCYAEPVESDQEGNFQTMSLRLLSHHSVKVFFNSIEWFNVSKALLRSRNIPRDSCFFSKAFVTCSTSSEIALLVEQPRLNPNWLFDIKLCLVKEEYNR